MRLVRALPATVFTILLIIGTVRVDVGQQKATPNVAVGPQYDSTHVYVTPDDFDRFVASFLATFGGTTSKQVVANVTPTPSSTLSQLILTPVGTISVFGYKTPVPYPFGVERTGYLVSDMDAAVSAARVTGDVVSDDDRAPGIEIGRPRDTYRRVRISSNFGELTVFVTDGQLPYPYGRELTGYEVTNLGETLAKAKGAGATILVGPYQADQRQASFVQFPGGYIAEIHSAVKK